MHDDELTMPARPPDRDNPGRAGDDKPAPVRRLPAELDHWQVWDVDASADAPDAEADSHLLQIPDQPDDLLIVTLPGRRWQAAPGDTLTLPVTVLNNSQRRLSVRAHLEGWLDDRWVTEPYLQVMLPPGERRTLALTISPPREATTEAGDYHLAVVVRSPDAPAHTARVGLLLTLAPFDRVLLDLASAPEQPLTWWRRSILLPVRVANEGNHTSTILLEGTTLARLGRVTFSGRAGDATKELTLRPGQRARIPVLVTAARLPVAALHSRSLPFMLSARTDDGTVMQQLRSAVEVRPIIGVWQMASFAGLAFAGGAALLMLVVVAALFLRAAAPERPSSAPVVPPPAIIVVTLNETMPPSGAGRTVNPATQPFSQAVQAQPDPALPLVLPDQVTSPGSGGPVRPNLAAPPASAPAGDVMTYAQMFQAVAAEYDLDWRMLAAQAYVESSFDALAMSSAGAMGLMQVLPTTWREWAPVVGASDPFDSYGNVQVAAVYLDYLRSRLAQQGHPETEWMLVAYNWGPDRLGDFLASGGGWQDLPAARRNYAEEILRIAETLP